MSLYLLGRCIPLDESVEEKVPISEKILPRSVSRRARREINEIVFAALARVAKTPRLKRLGRCRQ